MNNCPRQPHWTTRFYGPRPSVSQISRRPIENQRSCLMKRCLSRLGIKASKSEPGKWRNAKLCAVGSLRSENGSSGEHFLHHWTTVLLCLARRVGCRYPCRKWDQSKPVQLFCWRKDWTSCRRQVGFLCGRGNLFQFYNGPHVFATKEY